MFRELGEVVGFPFKVVRDAAVKVGDMTDETLGVEDEKERERKRERDNNVFDDLFD